MKIKQSPSGQIISLPKGYTAFIPHALPPEIKWDESLVNSLSRADFMVGRLSQEGGQLSNPYLLVRPFVAREAVLSSKIEGMQATLDDILASDSGAQVARSPDELQEVQNYIIALDYGIDRLKEFPLSLRLIKELHAHLMKGTRVMHATPGEFRRSQNWIGLPGSTINTATFVPPPSDKLMDCLWDLEHFMHDRQLPPLIHIALCHYQFEALHPFLDGNGRVGRLLIILMLIEQRVLTSPLLYLSAFFEATRSEYYRQLYNVSSQGSWNDWLIYFLNGISLQAEDTLSRIERINGLLEQWRLMVKNSLAVKIVEQLASNPYLTTNKVASNLNVAYSTAQRGIQKLEQAGIIKKVNDNKRGKLYCATRILDILEEGTKVNLDFKE